MSSPSGVSVSGTSSSSTPSYLQVLRLPGAARLFGCALWGRLSYGTVFLSLTLALTRATGSYSTTRRARGSRNVAEPGFTSTCSAARCPLHWCWASH
ncbi:MAG TPA: hypothetical protein VFN97_21940 [Actinospica sp.]|nr:hypothetical protein [Actinospica sp.]